MSPADVVGDKEYRWRWYNIHYTAILYNDC